MTSSTKKHKKCFFLLKSAVFQALQAAFKPPCNRLASHLQTRKEGYVASPGWQQRGSGVLAACEKDNAFKEKNRPPPLTPSLRQFIQDAISCVAATLKQVFLRKKLVLPVHLTAVYFGFRRQSNHPPAFRANHLLPTPVARDRQFRPAL